MLVTQNGASSEAVPSANAGVDMSAMSRMVDLEWVASLALTGGSATTYEVWGKRGSDWGLLGSFLAGASLATNTRYFAVLEDLRFFDRVALRCAGVGPTSYVFTLEEVEADG